jgi:hypothetical protein
MVDVHLLPPGEHIQPWCNLAMEEAEKHVPKQLQPYLWKKGQSGNRAEVTVTPISRPLVKSAEHFFGSVNWSYGDTH